MASNEEALEMKRKISLYYRDYFNPSSLLRLIGKNPFKNREFGYQSFHWNDEKNDYDFNRNINIKSPMHLINWASRNPPRKLYIGSQYRTEINGTINTTEWYSQHLRYDLDIDMSEEIRKYTCQCRGRQLCSNCLRIASEAVIFLIETNHSDFANPKFPVYRQNAETYFSGSRGMHVHYPNIEWVSTTKKKDDEIKLRRLLIDYFQMVKEPKKEGEEFMYLHEKFASKSLERKFYEYIVRWFFQQISTEKITAMKLFSSKNSKKPNEKKIGKKLQNASEIINRIKVDLSNDAELLLDKNKISEYGIYYPDLFPKILKCRYPRYDGSPTYDIAKLIKVPESVDGSSGYIVQKINYDDLYDLKYEDLKTVDHFVT